MKRQTKIIVAALAVVTVATGTVMAAGNGRMGERMISKLSDRLDLNDSQVSSLESLHLEIKETRELMRGSTGNDAQNLRELVTADTFDQGAALEMITARTVAMQTQAPELVAAAALFLDGLDVEQKEELNDLIGRFSDRKGRRHNHD